MPESFQASAGLWKRQPGGNCGGRGQQQRSGRFGHDSSFNPGYSGGRRYGSASGSIYPLTRAVAKIIQVRYTYLAPIIIIFCFAGAFAATGNTKELVLTAAILVFSYLLTLLDISSTPLMLGMILADIMEMNFVTSMMSYDKDYLIFFKRPISCCILILTVVLVISMIRINKKVEALNQEQMEAMKKGQEESRAEA